MAGNTPSDPFEIHHESAGYSTNDDFEKLDAPGSGFGFDHDNDADSHNDGSASYDRGSQDAEVSTTTDNAGEDKAEEDLCCVDYSEVVDANAHNSSEPPISISFGEEDKDDFQVHTITQPSAPVPVIGIDKSLIDFAEAASANIISSLATSVPFSSSSSPEPIPTTSNPDEEIDDIQTESDSKHVEVEVQEGAEEITKGSWLKGVDPRESKEAKADDSRQSCCFKDLIYWRDVKKTAIVFGTVLVVLLSLAIFSLVSVVAYLSLAVLTVTFSFVVYKKIMGAVQKSNDGHPFKPLLEMDITLSEEKLKSVIQNVLKNTNCALREVRRLFLVEDTVDSIKFGLLLWALTYIGSWFNGMSLIILALILLFTVPKVYETYQVQIDNYINLAKSQINNVLTIIQSKLPFLKKKEKAQ